jgi:hypothetical protein
MNCVNHPQTPAAAYCRTCGKALCTNCTRPVRGVIYCEDCLATRVEGLPPAAAQAQPPQPGVNISSTAFYNPDAPNPALAGILSAIFPFGVGVMYCGEFLRALVHAGIFIFLIVVESTTNRDAVNIIFGFAIAFWYFFMIVDSVRVARAKQRGEELPDLLGFGVGGPPQSTSAAFQLPAEAHRRPPLAAVILIALGILFLLSNVWDLETYWIWRFWPMLLILLGAYRLYLFFEHDHAGYRRSGRIMGPAIIITIGVMGMLAEFTRFGWGQSWPLILVVIGALKLMGMSGMGGCEPPGAVTSGTHETSQPSEVQQVHNG